MSSISYYIYFGKKHINDNLLSSVSLWAFKQSFVFYTIRRPQQTSYCFCVLLITESCRINRCMLLCMKNMNVFNASKVIHRVRDISLLSGVIIDISDSRFTHCKKLNIMFNLDICVAFDVKLTRHSFENNSRPI